ncbi:MAG: hypothetical protein MZV70_51690 [Desulfobacterales bacterium]|nr:hypothetical protein [Desulfobacterales bacterium]
MNLLSRILNRFTPRTSADRPAPQSVSISGGDRGALAIRAGWLIDGKGGPVRQNVRISVKDGIIAGLCWDAPAEPEGSAPEAIPDFSGCTVIPGLVDSHVHLTMTRFGGRGTAEKAAGSLV